MNSWTEAKHPRDKRGRFIRKRTPLPVGSGKGSRSYGVGRPGWPMRFTVDAGPGSGKKGTTVGGRVRYRSSRADVAVGVILVDSTAIRRRLRKASGRARKKGR